MPERLQRAATVLAVAPITSGCDSSGSIRACTLEPIDGTLIALPDGATAIDGAHWLATEWTRPVALRWPAGWTTSQATDGVVEVPDAKGTVKARTGKPLPILGGHAQRSTRDGGWRHAGLPLLGLPRRRLSGAIPAPTGA